ncbi:class I SAM-dependent methyltransferase [Psychrobacter sp. B38]|uniref:class I SAM-dependent DNA methyltransferase n=1 Tax=Psychrobacter sp. B38 TaxID=3143538 RepID=UPI003211764C
MNPLSKSITADNANTESHSDTYSESYFDALYSDNTDPWEYQTRWYEKRKRDMCLAVLPQAQYGNAIELGCGNGVFSELLARRCQALVSIDGNSQAVKLAKRRLAESSHVSVIQGVIPATLFALQDTLLSDCPLSDYSLSTCPLSERPQADGSLLNDSQSDISLINKTPFDLIVISEILYYLSPTDIDVVIAWIKQNLTSGGTLICCHWRYPIDGFEMTGETVHRRLQQAFNDATNEDKETHQQAALTHQSKLVDTDFLLDVWQNTSDSIAEQENLV